jgi:hypothetical protein
MVFNLILASLIIICKHNANHNMVNDLAINFLLTPFYLNFNLFSSYYSFQVSSHGKKQSLDYGLAY